MSLKDILAARKAATNTEPTLAEQFFKPFEEKDEDDLEVNYYSNLTYLANHKVDDLFLAVYTPLISYPYQLFHDHFEYATFILDDNRHVLNTFQPINPDRLFQMYMKHNPPQCAADLYRLHVTISRICLVFPPIYLPLIQEIIEKSEKFAKNSEMRQTKPYLNVFKV